MRRHCRKRQYLWVLVGDEGGLQKCKYLWVLVRGGVTHKIVSICRRVLRAHLKSVCHTLCHSAGNGTECILALDSVHPLWSYSQPSTAKSVGETCVDDLCLRLVRQVHI